MLLIISQKDDIHVLETIKYLKCNYEIIDTGDYPEKIEISYHYDSEEPLLKHNGKKIDISKVTCIWNRRPFPANLSRFNGNINRFVKRETEDSLYGFYWNLERKGVRLYNHPFDNYTASIKPLQYKTAVICGLNLPKTFIGNNASEAKLFLTSNKEKIIKGVSLSWAIDEKADKHYSIFVKKADQKAIDNIDSIKFCPATIQEYIEKIFDLRVIVIDNKIFAYEIHVDGNNEIKIDWRHGGEFHNSIKYKTHNFSEENKLKILNFMKMLNLRFGALDFSVDINGNYYFLEINPNGQWLWLHNVGRYDLRKEIASVLSQ